jgi:hypothetical protein
VGNAIRRAASSRFNQAHRGDTWGRTIKQFAAQGVEPRRMSSRDFYNQIKAEERQLKDVIQTARIGQ